MASNQPLNFEAVKAVYESLQAKKRRKDEIVTKKDKVAVERSGIIERLQELYPDQNWEKAYQQDMAYLQRIQDTITQTTTSPEVP